MSPALLRLAADLLSMAADEFGNHGCNDYDLPETFTEADLEALALLANRANFRDRPPETWPVDDVQTAADLRRNAHDFVVMGALAFGLREMAKRSTS